MKEEAKEKFNHKLQPFLHAADVTPCLLFYLDGIALSERKQREEDVRRERTDRGSTCADDELKI
jgi:hypothetical protein